MGLRTLRRDTGRKAANAKHRAEAARPRRSQATGPVSSHPDPEQESDSPAPSKVRTGIVSVNGRDIEIMHCRRP